MKQTTYTPTKNAPAAPSSSLATPSPTAYVTSNPAYLGPAPMDLSAAQKQVERERIYQKCRSSFFCAVLLAFAVKRKSDGVLSEWENPESIYSFLPSR